MQGNQTEPSILDAMQQIESRYSEFDVLVIIRGGGATSDLACFDSYLLASAVAQFPLPVITGIGHERDETVLDRVAHTTVKTPTAAAALLIDRVGEAAAHLVSLSDRLHDIVTDRLNEESQKLLLLRNRIPAIVLQQLNTHRSILVASSRDLYSSADRFLLSSRHHLSLMASKIADASPEKILAKGYSITMVDGKILKDVSKCKTGSELVTRLYKGEVKSKMIDLVNLK
jgi:exodeoxyribonuclease VII large subunit